MFNARNHWTRINFEQSFCVLLRSRLSNQAERCFDRRPPRRETIGHTHSVDNCVRVRCDDKLEGRRKAAYFACEASWVCQSVEVPDTARGNWQCCSAMVKKAGSVVSSDCKEAIEMGSGMRG